MTKAHENRIPTLHPKPAFGSVMYGAWAVL